MRGICLIGGSPSSGSTLLTHLLARHENVLCLPETGLFAHGRNLVADAEEPKCEELGWQLPWLDTQAKVRGALGWSAEFLENGMSVYPTAFDLLRAYVDPKGQYWLVEKTPENIFAFERYLSANPQSRVVVTSRDALASVQSMMRRGFNMLEALLIWFSHSFEIALLILRHPSQVYHCAYDRLTAEPEKIVAEITAFQGVADGPPPREEILMDPTIYEISAKGIVSDDLESLHDLASWRLSDTVWMRAPDQEVHSSRRFDLLGMDFDVLMDTIAFLTVTHHLVRPAILDKLLRGERDMLPNGKNLKGTNLKIDFSSLLTSSLATCYTPCLVEI